MLSSQFAQFGIPSVDGRVVSLSHDGSGVYESFATGRLNVHRLWVEMRLNSRHDLVAWMVEGVMGFLYEGFAAYGDVVEVVVDPSCDWEGFTWSVVKKGKMLALRDKRYDLVWIPKAVQNRDFSTQISLGSFLPRSISPYLFRMADLGLAYVGRTDSRDSLASPRPPLSLRPWQS